MSQTANIISGGRLGDRAFFLKKLAEIGKSLIICCDGGARHLENTGIKPDVIIGDMDSIDLEQLKKYRDQGVKIIEHPANKDFTDTELALDYAIGLKPEAIYIWGASGGRLDHTLANIFLLGKGEKAGIKTFLLDEYCEAFVLSKDVNFKNAAGCTVSLIALSGQVEGITLKGFLYPLAQENLVLGESRGISNIVSDATASIDIKSGSLLVVRYWQKDIFPEAI